jgi:tetratricopeptide (TPR) repeat protein
LISSRRSSRLVAIAAAALALAACASRPPRTAPFSAAPVELASVPFFPQTEYQCGPAALATVLANEGLPVDADTLVREVYVEGLRGSLQAELLGATRRHGLIPYVLAPEPAALFSEVAAGRPVLVLQNLGLERVPVWHYAVVVGFDRDADRVILRSGTEQRRLERTARFLKTWQRGGRWAFVAIEPGVLPATATAALYVRALAGAEPLLPSAAASDAFALALANWPDDELVLFAAAGHELGAGDLRTAAAHYRRLLERAPAHAAARNNLANVLSELGCHAQALTEARAALSAATPAGELYAAIRDTVDSLESAAAHGDAPRCP